MAKHIIVCSDGTGNTAVKGRGTNVFKIFEAVDLNGHRFDPLLPPQVAIYDDGVGTESFKPLKLLGGAFGFGLSRNVRQLYKELCRIYDPGDRIFLFGFSRGAFTVRTLAGFIGACGILTQQPTSDALEDKVSEAYEVYRRRYRTALMRAILGPPDPEEANAFRARNCHGGEAIAFIGVWDTVDAVGLPLPIASFINAALYQFKFPNYRLGASVERACHALAIDDERESFHPLLWDERVEPGKPRPNIEQVWFAGAHSNVGGGYEKQGMSLVALDWMMERAERAGLRFVAAERSYYRDHANVDDKLYDPRAGLGTFYRWLPRDIVGLCTKNGVEPTVHLSVLERAAHGTADYCPGNLPPRSQVTFTSTHDPLKDRLAAERARAVRQVLAGASPDGRPLSEHVRHEVRVGRAAYGCFVSGVLATWLLAVVAEPGGLALDLEHVLAFLRLPIGLLTTPLATGLAAGEALLRARFWLALPIAGFMGSYLCAWYSHHGIRRTFSRFWFGLQKGLRDALKRARAGAAAGSGTVSTPPPAPEAAEGTVPAAGV